MIKRIYDNNCVCVQFLVSLFGVPFGLSETNLWHVTGDWKSPNGSPYTHTHSQVHISMHKYSNNTRPNIQPANGTHQCHDYFQNEPIRRHYILTLYHCLMSSCWYFFRSHRRYYCCLLRLHSTRSFPFYAVIIIWIWSAFNSHNRYTYHTYIHSLRILHCGIAKMGDSPIPF